MLPAGCSKANSRSLPASVECSPSWLLGAVLYGEPASHSRRAAHKNHRRIWAKRRDGPCDINRRVGANLKALLPLKNLTDCYCSSEEPQTSCLLLPAYSSPPAYINSFHPRKFPRCKAIFPGQIMFLSSQADLFPNCLVSSLPPCSSRQNARLSEVL